MRSKKLWIIMWCSRHIFICSSQRLNFIDLSLERVIYCRKSGEEVQEATDSLGGEKISGEVASVSKIK